MKNIIYYYYDIDIDEYKKSEEKIIFLADNTEYEFVECYNKVSDLLNIYYHLQMNNRVVYDILLNKDNSVLTHYNNKSYILIKKNNINLEKLTLLDIIKYNCNIYSNSNLNWKELWKNKIDYYEIQLEQIGNKFPTLKKSFSYYVGLSEIAINLLNYVDYSKVNFCICHRRIQKKEDLINPLNMIVDNITRDIAEFIKIKYFIDEIEIMEVIEFLNLNYFTKEESILFLSRLIYPSYYFDLYEKVYSERENEKSINKIIEKNVSYETFLKKIYNHIKSRYKIPRIEFLES